MNLRLKSLAYRMLGSSADAEDVVQEAQLRLHQADPRPDNAEAFLYRVVSNLCVDRLRREQVKRKAYFGPWLPEPLLAEQADLAEMAEQLSMGFMLMLEELSPAERVVFVLREGFDYSFKEIAEVLDATPAAVRQRARRARQRLKDARQVEAVPPQAQKHMLEAMLARVAEGDAQGLINLMTEDAVVYADGGGVVSAAIAPIYGRERIAQVTLFLASKLEGEGTVTYAFQTMNGGWGLVIKLNGEVHSCFQVGLRDGLIQDVYVVRNPHKLARLNS